MSGEPQGAWLVYPEHGCAYWLQRNVLVCAPLQLDGDVDWDAVGPVDHLLAPEREATTEKVRAALEMIAA